jgi:anti-sigma regulatory factor (Ser/Thr protein kinase)
MWLSSWGVSVRKTHKSKRESMNSLLLLGHTQESDVVLVRQRARQIAALLEFDTHEQTRISTAVSEIVCNAFPTVGGAISPSRDAPEHLIIRISDWPGIFNRRRFSPATTPGTAWGWGFWAPSMDTFRADSVAGHGTTVEPGRRCLLSAWAHPELVLHHAELATLAPTARWRRYASKHRAPPCTRRADRGSSSWTGCGRGG